MTNYAWIQPILSPRFSYLIISTSLQVTETSYIMLMINHVAKSTVKVSHISMTIILSNSTCLKEGDIFSSLSSKLYAFSLSAILYALRM